MDVMRPLFYGPEHAPADYEAKLGDPGEFPYTRGTRRPTERREGVPNDETILRELSGEG